MAGSLYRKLVKFNSELKELQQMHEPQKSEEVSDPEGIELDDEDDADDNDTDTDKDE